MNSKELSRSILKTDSFLSINKKILKQIGIIPTILLTDLISKEEYFYKKNQTTKDGFFYNTMENIEEDTTLSPKQQRRALSILEEFNLIKTKLIAKTPQKNYKPIKHFKLNYDEIISLLSKDSNVTKSNIDNVTKGHPNNNNSINKSFNKLKDKGFSKNPIDSKKRKQPKINNFTLRMIGIWNQCPNTSTKHKTNVPTKLILSIQKHLTALRSGTFNDHVDLSTDFKKRNYITNEYLNKKYTKKEISNILKNSLLHYKEGYWPENKNKLPQSLDKLFYNSGKYSTKRLETGGTSFFLKAAVTNPRRLRKPKSNDEVDKLIDATRSKEPMTEEEFNKYMNLSLPDGIDLH